MATINISGLDKAKLLAALYDASSPVAMGMMQFDPAPMTNEEAQLLLDGHCKYFDYIKGRVMKVDLAGDEMPTDFYNRDNGPGAAEAIVASMRPAKEV